jgi:phospholipid/cholesterol/gamma-HCH transport system ATP-binding protein
MPAMERELVSCRDLVSGYDGNAVTGPVTFTVRRGEIVALVGGSGSGKSTLLRTLLGLLPPVEGGLCLFGTELGKLEAEAKRALYRRIGVLFQGDALLTSVSVIDNVTLPLRELTDLPEPVVTRLGRARLSLLEIASLENSLPSQVSGGQAKRTALARATILDPELLFCDEPTSGLDPPTAGQIDRTLLRFRDVLGMTVFAVTHDLESVRSISDRVLVLGRGGILAAGRMHELERHEDPEVQRFFERRAGAESGKAPS